MKCRLSLSLSLNSKKEYLLMFYTTLKRVVSGFIHLYTAQDFEERFEQRFSLESGHLLLLPLHGGNVELQRSGGVWHEGGRGGHRGS